MHVVSFLETRRLLLSLKLEIEARRTEARVLVVPGAWGWNVYIGRRAVKKELMIVVTGNIN